MKVIIVGGGLAGLSTCVALRKYLPQNPNESEHDIRVYEKYTHYRNDNQGAALGLQGNGLRVLRDLDPDLHDRTYSAGNPCRHFTWMTAGGIRLGRSYLSVLPISRPILLDCLRRSLPDEAVTHKGVSEVVARQGMKPVVRFADGSPDETADLVVGADGVGSPVRHDLFGSDARYHAKYE